MGTGEDREPASFRTVAGDSDETVVLTGDWTLHGLGHRVDGLVAALRPYAQRPAVIWNCTQLHALDSAGALVLWRIHGYKRPQHVIVRPEHQALFRRWSARQPATSAARGPRLPVTELAARLARDLHDQVTGFITLLGQIMLDCIYLISHPTQTPWRDIAATIYEAGVRALGITALVGALVGIVMSYLSALELTSLGAQALIVNILGLSILRELGPMLAAILVAGRSGSSMAAELGVMSVTEELDALSAMGISRTLRLILPKIVALAITLPLLVAWTDLIGLLGGMVTAHIALGISFSSFIQALPDAVPIVNLLLGLLKGVVFGIVIAFIACHFGLRIKPNTQSLSIETTNAVVSAITAVIFVDAVFAILFRGVGLP